MIYFKNKDASRGVSAKTGKEFVVAFEIRSHVLREDGEMTLVKEDSEGAYMDLLSFLKDDKKELIAYLKKEQIDWQKSIDAA